MTETNNQAPTTCPECGGEIINKKGVSKKTGNPYNLWGCKNYPECKYVWHPPKETPKTNGMAIMYDEITTRLDKQTEAIKIMDQNLKNLIKFIENKLG